MYDAKKDLITVDQEIEALTEKIKLLKSNIEALERIKNDNVDALVFSPRATTAYNDLRFYADITSADEIVIIAPDSAVLIYN